MVSFLILICPRLYKGLLLQSDADHITILPGGILDIRNFNEEVQGTYTCIASTATDFIESEFHLTLKEKCHLGNFAKISDYSLADKWRKYCRYGVKHYNIKSINQSIDQLFRLVIIFLNYIVDRLVCEFFTHMESSPMPLKGCKFALCSALHCNHCCIILTKGLHHPN